MLELDPCRHEVGEPFKNSQRKKNATRTRFPGENMLICVPGLNTLAFVSFKMLLKRSCPHSRVSSCPGNLWTE